MTRIPGASSSASASSFREGRRWVARFACALAVVGASQGAARAEEATNGPVLADYTLEGDLAESEATLRPVFDLALPVGRPWNKDVKHQVEQFCERLSYLCEVTTSTQQRGVSVKLTLSRLPRVRYVNISGNFPLFEDDIRSRLQLRPGTPLAPEKPTRAGQESRAQQLTDERESIKSYLMRLGYHDARVLMTLEDLGDEEYRLVVKIFEGPRYRIGKVKIQGNRAVSEARILEELATDPWWKRLLSALLIVDTGFTEENLDRDLEDIRKIYLDAGYPRAQVTSNYNRNVSIDRLTKTVNFVITINEGKKLDVVFEGQSEAMGEGALREALTFDEEGAYDDYEVDRSKAAIRERYQKSGFFQAQVAHERVTFAPEENYERILFYIDEGPRLLVVKIDFAGNKTFSTARLRGLINTRVHPGKLAFAVSGGYVTNLQLQQDVDSILSFYKRQGFSNARVSARVAMDDKLLDDMGALAAAVTAGEKGHGLHIRFDIEEGTRDVVAVREFIGNRKVTDAMLAARTRLAKGVPFTPAHMEADVEEIRRVYSERGHQRAVVEAEHKGIGDQISVRYVISEGEPVRVGKVLVRGNFKTRGWVIRDVLGVGEGDVLTLGRLEALQVNLRTTNLFNSQFTKLIGLEASDGPVHVLVEVTERHDNFLDAEIGGGFSTDNFVFASLNVGLRNLFGIGVALVISGEVGTEIQRGSATLTLPLWVMRRATGGVVPLKLDAQVKYRKEDSERFDELETRGLSVSLSRQLGAGFSLSLKYDYNLFNRDEELVRPAGASQDDDLTKIQTITASLGPTIVLDRRKNVFGLPTPLSAVKGYYLSAGAAIASRYLLGTSEFLKFQLAGQGYVPIGERVVIATGLRYDHGIPLEGVLLPEVERFTAGGDTTVRGYEEDRLHTEVIRDPLQPIGGIEQYRVVPAGGNIRIIHNLDVQVRVGTLFGFPLATAIFLDTGIVTNSLDQFRVQNLRHGLGVALVRLISPVASFSFEYAVPLDPEEGDDPTGRVHFNLGFVF